jgi:NADH-quinone oxidoreductase subunit M
MTTGILILFPLFCALLLFFLKDEKLIRTVAVLGSVMEFIISLFALFQFTTQCNCHLLLFLGSLDPLGISLRFGLNGISLLLVLLTTFLIPLIILSTLQHKYRAPAVFYGLIMIMEMAFVGVFSSFDGILFYIFWELALVPAYFISAFWGGEDRIRITLKFFAYTFTGSLFMLVGLIYLFFKTPAPHSFDLSYLMASRLTVSEQYWIFSAFLLAFAVKIPIVPFHTWQPETYSVAPTGGTMILSGIMLKMGIFGIIRFMVPICPAVFEQHGVLITGLILAGAVYASVIAIMQKDLKRLIAYSSVAHVGIITAGIFTLTEFGINGSVLQMVSHGINIVGLFMVVDRIERHMKTTQISDLGGIARSSPWLAVFFMIFLLGSISLPLTNGFVGEFLIFLGIFGKNPWLAAFAGVTIIMSALYMLRMYQRTMLGPVNNTFTEVTDLTWQEALPMIPLVIMVFWIGIFPGFFLQVAGPAVKEIMHFIHT